MVTRKQVGAVILGMGVLIIVMFAILQGQAEERTRHSFTEVCLRNNIHQGHQPDQREPGRGRRCR